jgi:hypothetical protein
MGQGQELEVRRLAEARLWNSDLKRLNRQARLGFLVHGVP